MAGPEEPLHLLKALKVFQGRAGALKGLHLDATRHLADVKKILNSLWRASRLISQKDAFLLFGIIFTLVSLFVKGKIGKIALTVSQLLMFRLFSIYVP